MVRNLEAAETAGRLTNKLGTYLRPGVLVVDEVGYQPLERAEANLVFQVISKRYEEGSIIRTSNETFSKAHMFRRTSARCCRTATGSPRYSGRSRSQASCGHPPRARVRCSGSSGSSVAAARR